MATKKTFKQFISPDLKDVQFISSDLKGVSNKDLEDAREYLNPNKTPEQKKKMN